MQSTDVKITRQADGTFQDLNTSEFSTAGKYSICWKSPLIDYEAYVSASDWYWNVREAPVLSSNSIEFKLNDKVEPLYFDREYDYSDQFMLVKGTDD